MSKELIRLQDLIMEFDGERILDGINLYINDHEFLTLLGGTGVASVERTAKTEGCIPYELLTSLGTRLPRVYLNE